jgi:phospholipid/cholesterol/gamma-HCH transport system ATP-binding protein
MTPGPSNEGDPNEAPPNQASPAESASRGGPQSPKIRIRDLYKSFGTKHVLSGMDLDVGAGESVVVIGGSGSGKSVTLKCVLGLLQPEEGSIQVDGEEVVGLGGESLELVRRKFGMLFQNAALFDSLTVWQNVAFGLIQGQGMARRQAREIAFDRLTAVGLEAEVGNMWPAELSGGMRKRVGLARAIATSPDIIFFDEPTTGLDPIMGDVIDELIVKCVRELGATALSITHDMASARKISDRIAMLYDGRIIWAGPTAEIDRSNNPYVDQFIHGRAEGPIASMVNA